MNGRLECGPANPPKFERSTPWRPSGHCGLLTVDISSFGDKRRNDYVRRHVRRVLYSLLRDSFEHCHFSIEACYHEDRGDGVMVAVPPEIRTIVLVSALMDRIFSGLRGYNEIASDVAQIRLRVGIHTGEVDADDYGLVGAAVNHAFRLLDAPLFKQALINSGATLAVITSERVYDDVIRHSSDLINPGEYQRVTVRNKELVASAWMRLFGPVNSSFINFDHLPHRLVARRSITSFVGRGQDLVELCAVIDRSRLTTLIGPGGVGKTRLAEEAVRTLAGQADSVCADGAYIVDLAGYHAGDDICQAVLTTLQLSTRSSYGPPGRGPSDDALVSALAGSRVLLVLDNCEQLLDEVAVVAEALLGRTEEVSLLATSREMVGLAGETVVAVNPLGLPSEGDSYVDPRELLKYPAVQLFCDRARAADPGFQLTADNGLDIGSVCRSLDGLPLPIELAAARVRALTPTQISDRLADRFRLLDRGSRTVPRHRTLQAVVDWSYDLLDESTRETFEALSVFRGEFTLSAAEDLMARLGMRPMTTADLVVKLVDKSLLEAKAADNRVMRYKMLETLREYATDRLRSKGRLRQVQEQHAALYVELSEHHSASLSSPGQATAIRTLEREDGNLRAAFEFSSQTGNHSFTLRLVAALGLYLRMRGDRVFGWPSIARALDVEPDNRDLPHQARAMIWSCHLGAMGHNFVDPKTRAHGLQAAAILDRLGLTHTADYSMCGLVNAFAYYQEGQHDIGNTMVDQSLRLAGELRDPWLTASATMVVGIGHAMRSEFTEATQQLKASAECFRTVGDAWGEHRALVWLSRTYECLGQAHQAEETAESAVALARSLNLGGAVVPLLSWIARLQALQGKDAIATSTLAAVEHDRWWHRNPETVGWIADCQAQLTENRIRQQADNPGLLHQAVDLHSRAATALTEARFLVHAVHNRCRQAVLLHRLNEPSNHPLEQASELAETYFDHRAIALVLDTRCLLASDKQSAARWLARADSQWPTTGVGRSPQFDTEIEQLRSALRQG